MKKKYISPSFEVIELSLKENALATFSIGSEDETYDGEFQAPGKDGWSSENWSGDEE